MNRSFSSPLGKSPFSPRQRQGHTTKKLLPANFRKSSRFSASGRSTQSMQVILSTPYNYVERFGQPLPVLITEALTFVDKNTVVTARISKNDFAWVVCGRRLLIWQYRQSPAQFGTPQKKAGLQCFELQLPQSDLAHRAELVSVFTGLESGSSPSCIAVSPAGVVRYWPAVVHEELSIEESIKLDGQECDSLVDVEGLGCILATTSSTVLLIQPQQVAGRHSLATHLMKIPTGWLGGIGRRMSSLIFGPISSDHSSETGIVRVLSIRNSNESYAVYVLADGSLQKWRLTRTEQALKYVTELNQTIRDNFRNALWDNSSLETEIELFLLDVQADSDNVTILAAAVNLPVSPRVHYAIIHIDTKIEAQIRDFLLLKITDMYREEDREALNYRFLVSGTYSYLFNRRGVTVLKPHEEPDLLEFSANQDCILAGSICVNTPVFFSRNHGLVSVSSNEISELNATNTPLETSLNESLNQTGQAQNLTLYQLAPTDLEEIGDSVAQLKAAFLFFVHRQESDYRRIIDTEFPSSSVQFAAIDAVLDKSVVSLAKELLNDIPTNDPRWNKDLPVGIGSSNAMQVLQQLENKQKAFTIFVSFLKESGLWARLGVVSVRGGLMASVYLLGECMEKVLAARILKSMVFGKAIEVAVKRVVAEMEVNGHGNELSEQDLFYREVDGVGRFFQELVNYCEDICHSNAEPSEIIELIEEANDVILGVLKEVVKFRKQNVENFRPSDQVIAVAPGFLPWTAANGSDGLSHHLSQMHYLTYNYGIVLTENERLKNRLFEQLMELTDLLLDGRTSHLESVKGTETEEISYKQYCSDRQKYMKPFIKEKEWERSITLGEKYLDFDTLIRVCDATDNQLRLDDYLKRFSGEGFNEHLYNWFLKENKQGKLINKKNENLENLTNFLTDHPSLAWMQNIFDKKYAKAADTLRALAAKETESITRQKTMLSLCKLAKWADPLATDNSSYLGDVDSKLELIAFQEDIPDYVLQHFGYDTVNIRVIPQKDLIELYISSEFKESTELEFKKALDLLNFVADEELRGELLLKIWRASVLKDSWNEANLDSPLEILQNKLFFRLVDLAMTLDGDALALLPPLEALLDDESVAELKNNAKFQFLLKTGYEHVYKTHAIN